MANRTITRPGGGETRLGTTRTGALENVLTLNSPIGQGSYLAVQDTAGVTWYLSVDVNGKVRVYSALPVGTQQASTGTIVGTQS